MILLTYSVDNRENLSTAIVTMPAFASKKEIRNYRLSSLSLEFVFDVRIARQSYNIDADRYQDCQEWQDLSVCK